MSSETIATGPKRKSKLIRLPFQQSCRRRQHELEFLPAALEIIETPASAAGRVMMGVIVVFVSVAIGWACVGQIDIVATANGRIIPSGQVKMIQPLEIGVVKSIRVADGDRVAAGDLLIEIDPTTARPIGTVSRVTSCKRNWTSHASTLRSHSIPELLQLQLARTQPSPMPSVGNWSRSWHSTGRR